MTANRWWVKAAARWIARVGGVEGHLRLAMLVLTGVSTATLTLRQYGHGQYAWPLIAVVLAGTVVYTYLYTEGGVWNQTTRDKMDLSNNFAGPTIGIDDVLIGVAAFVAINGREPSQEECAMIERAVKRSWLQYRDGIDWAEETA